MPQPNQGAEHRFMVTNTLIVRDIPRSVAFYSDKVEELLVKLSKMKPISAKPAPIVLRNPAFGQPAQRTRKSFSRHKESPIQPCHGSACGLFGSWRSSLHRDEGAPTRAGVPLAGLTQQRGFGQRGMHPHPLACTWGGYSSSMGYAAASVTAPFRNVSRSALIVSASVVGMPWGKFL
jgi:hypothetical protein